MKSNRLGVAAALATALVVLVLAVYARTASFQFVFDDRDYVTGNPYVARGLSVDGIVWAFSATHSSNWHPVTWLSHMADVSLFGMNPGGHHLTGVAIHAVSAALLLFLLFRLTRSLWRSGFVAALFAIHPTHVESVAWVAERKDVLSAFFMFGTLLLYAEYAARRRPALYLAALAAFVLGLMAKPMLVTLPLVMLLLDFWPLGRYRDEEGKDPGQRGRMTALVREKLPFFACALASGLVTMYAQHAGGATRSLQEFPMALRAQNAATSYGAYLLKTLWPHDLAVYYPFPSAIPLWQVLGSLLLVLFVSVLAVKFRREAPYLPVGWFWFLIGLLPVIGLFQVGSQSMADRYTYLPGIGLYIIAAWGGADLARGVRSRQTVLGVLAGVAIAGLTVKTWHQLDHWRDDVSLYRHTLEVTSGNHFIAYNLGFALAEQGDLDGAILEYREALRMKPEYAKAHSSLAIALTQQGNLDAAVQEYREALRLNPADPRTHNNLGIVYATQGDLDAAAAEFSEAVRLDPGFAEAERNLGFALHRKNVRTLGSR